MKTDVHNHGLDPYKEPGPLCLLAYHAKGQELFKISIYYFSQSSCSLEGGNVHPVSISHRNTVSEVENKTQFCFVTRNPLI